MGGHPSDPSQPSDPVSDPGDDAGDRAGGDAVTADSRTRADRQAAPTGADLAAQYAATSGVRRSEDGQIDVLSSIGGVQGLAESIAPGLVFTVLFTFTRDLTLSLVAALAVSAVFTVIRLVSRTPVTQALAGLVGVAFCAFVALRTGNAEDFFLPGFFINGAYIVAMAVSVVVRWPFAGLLFGFIRNEGIEWRRQAVRVRAYSLATWIIVAVLALRLVVQVPLYLAENVAALGSTRVAMGLPLYALGLWLAWVISRPPAAPGGAASTEGSRPDDRSGAGTDG
ncbi:DUF3159 domain-containing protein [Arthrobacter agilis]|uniref:DUF3159 domain-containing protein n=1 Tax=Arthrobacter agilis TaxID=37921 RepID=UPI000B361FF4|nr:potassium ABC transporter [Arthrobacter agilis]PPB46933.1 DUF3159 domain-containing protein [Arthrobacter agilis]TPV23561.1 DUF3159 domain-containing protein [Arthrobacter agilis]